MSNQSPTNSKLNFISKLTVINEKPVDKLDKQINSYQNQLSKIIKRLGPNYSKSFISNQSPSMNTPINNKSLINSDQEFSIISPEKPSEIKITHQHNKLFKGHFQKSILNKNRSDQKLKSERSQTVENESKNLNSDFKKLALQNLSSSVKKIDHLKLIAKENNKFIKNLKRSMSFDMIDENQKKNKELQESQKMKNLIGKDLEFTDIKVKYDKFMNHIFGEIKRSEDEARIKNLRKNSMKNVTNTIINGINNQISSQKPIERNLSNEIPDIFNEEAESFNKQMSNANKLWKNVTTDGESDNDRLQIKRDQLREFNKEYNNKYIFEEKFDVDNDFENNFNWNFRDDKF